MATTAQVRAAAIRHLLSKRLKTAGWADVVAAFQAATPAERQAFARNIVGGSSGSLQKLSRRLLRAHLAVGVAVSVDAALADGSLTLAELKELYF